MLTICPTCRHRFLQPRHFQEPSEQDRWKEAKKEDEKEKIANTVSSTTATCYVGSLLVPREYTNGDNCFVSAPIIHGSTVEPFQSAVAHCDSDIGIVDSETAELSCDSQSSRKQDDYSLLSSWKGQLNNQAPLIMAVENVAYETSSEQHIVTTCKLTGGSVTITTPDVQWSNGSVQSIEDGIRVQPPHIEIRPKLTGGGCLIQKNLSTETEQLLTSQCTENSAVIDNNARQMLIVSPNGCSELPGNKWIFSPRTTKENGEITSPELKQQPNTIKTNKCCDCSCSTVQQKLCQCYQRSSDASLVDNRDSLLLKPIGNGVQIRFNATVKLPANLGQCTWVNITATTAPCDQVTKPTTKPRTRNNFNGGGIVQPEEADCATKNRIIAIEGSNSNEWKNETPMSWLMSCPWSLGADLLNKGVNRLREVRRLLQICGWYHEGITWQQSEDLLKNAPVGRWLMRDSSDSKFIFAVSIQTARGPTSVRVHYFLEQFRFDAEPRLTLTMPFFSCPISMLEHYVEYSKIEHRKEVWVDYNGQLYSHIYLTKPLVKEVRTLSHLARLAVNRNKLPTKHLPLLIRNYLAEYPYTL